MIQRASISVFLLLCVVSFAARAQHFSDNGRFQLDKVQGCAPLSINITINAPSICGPGNACVVDFDEGAGGEAFTTTHNFTTPGTYKMTILFGSTTRDEIIITVLPDIQPEFEVYGCTGGGNTVVVNITDTNYDEYTISYSDGFSIPVSSGATDTHSFGTGGPKTVSVKGRKFGYEDNCTPKIVSLTVSPTLPDGSITQLVVPNPNEIALTFNTGDFTLYKLEVATNSSSNFQTFKNIYNTTSLTVDNLRTDNNFYCFRLGKFDACTNTVLGYSDVICSADFDVTAQNGFNKIEWVTSTTNVTGYSISKSDNNAAVFTPLAATPAISSLNDPDIICGTTYTYQLLTTYVNGSTSTSLLKDARAFSTIPPTAIQNITTIVNEKTVDIAWLQDPAFKPAEYSVYKIANGVTSLLTTTTTPVASDLQYNKLTPTCYQIGYKDVCGNKSSITTSACPMQLRATLTPTNDSDLDWNDYTGWLSPPTDYIIRKFDIQGQLLNTFGSVSSDYKDLDDDPTNQVYRYVVEAVSTAPGLANSVSDVVIVIKDPNLNYPTAFTPNGDNFNDVFKVEGQDGYVVSYQIKIFNRWGELMFTTNNLSEGWDGKFQGNEMPEGTYVYVSKITDMAGQTFDQSGSVLLLKRN